MSLELHAGTIVDLAAAFDFGVAGGRLRPAQWRDVKLQRGQGPFWAIRDPDGRTVAVGGLSYQAEGAEAWFLPTELFAAQLLPALALIRLTLERVPYRGVIGACVGTPAGRAMARLLRGRPMERADGREVYVWAAW